MNDKYEMKEGQGSLWESEPDGSLVSENCRVVRKGKIKIEGEDRYSAILEYYDKRQGTKKYELVVSAGLLRHNKPEDKRRENSPDIYGSITFNNNPYKFGGWANETKYGKNYTGVQLQPKEDEKEENQFEQDRENIPF